MYVKSMMQLIYKIIQYKITAFLKVNKMVNDATYI